jgi:hypothetical protein
MVSWTGSAVAGTHSLRHRDGAQWDMEPRSPCPKRRPIQLRILLYFLTNRTLRDRFLRPRVPSVPSSQNPLIFLFYL